MTATTIVLADDHKVVREGLRALLERDEDICIVGEASDGLEAMHLIEQSDPDVLIVDVGMPVMNGIEVTRLVAQRYSRRQGQVRVQEQRAHRSGGHVPRDVETRQEERARGLRV